MSKIRWGIIGAGRIAKQFANDTQYAKNAELAGIAARQLESAEKFAEEFNAKKAYGNYADMYADPDIDAIYIATPHSLHLEQATDILASGKAVLCEKPLNINVEETKQLTKIAKESDQYLIEGMWTYFLPAVQKALSWYKEGKIGEIKHIKVDFGYPQVYSPNHREYDARLGGGCLLEMGIYPIALTWLFMQQEPVNMQGLGRFAPNGVEDDVVMIFDYPDAVSTMATSFRSKLQNWAYIIGRDGYIAIPDFWRAHECHLYHLDSKIDSFTDNRKGNGFEHEITAVSDDILNGRKTSEVVPLETSLIFQQQIAAVKEVIKSS